jgi:hypothetical protein
VGREKLYCLVSTRSSFVLLIQKLLVEVNEACIVKSSNLVRQERLNGIGRGDLTVLLTRSYVVTSKEIDHEIIQVMIVMEQTSYAKVDFKTG